MARVQIRTVLSIFGLVCLLGYILQYYYLNADDQQIRLAKSRRGRLEVLESTTVKTDLKCKTANNHLHSFYYPWYSSKEFDGQWIHWNHKILPHWEKRVNEKFLIGQEHIPPDDLGTTYYPLLGPYSSKNISVVDQHLRWACDAGIGTFVVSYYAKGRTDSNGIPFQGVVSILFDRAEIYGIKIAFHMEPYENRTALSVVDDIKIALREFGTRETFARDPKTSLPIFYIYDSYQIPVGDWKKALGAIKNTEYDAYTVGLIVTLDHVTEVVKSGFKAAYSYFASMNFSFGCTAKNWVYIDRHLKASNMDFLPSVGPGYDDTAVRPWNKAHTKVRDGGNYYEEYFQKAVSLRPKFISVTSFNEWHEGTQIEPAIPYIANNRFSSPLRYLNYNNPYQYIEITKRYSKQFIQPSVNVY